MGKKAMALGKRKCRHLWIDLGFSVQNGKRYRRCERCGLIKEEFLSYIA